MESSRLPSKRRSGSDLDDPDFEDQLANEQDDEEYESSSQSEEEDEVFEIDACNNLFAIKLGGRGGRHSKKKEAAKEKDSHYQRLFSIIQEIKYSILQ